MQQGETTTRLPRADNNADVLAEEPVLDEGASRRSNPPFHCLLIAVPAARLVPCSAQAFLESCVCSRVDMIYSLFSIECTETVEAYLWSGFEDIHRLRLASLGRAKCFHPKALRRPIQGA